MRITKRQKFIFLSVSLSLAVFLISQFEQQNYSIPILVALTIFWTLWALDFDLRFPEHLIFSIYPFLLTTALLLNLPSFYPFVPLSFHPSILLPKLSFLVLGYFVFYVFLFYVLLLSLNILNVATVRTVPLKKAAFSTLYFLGMVVSFLMIRGVLSLEFELPILFLSVFLVDISLALPLFYMIQIKAVVPEENTEQRGNQPKLFLIESVVLSLIPAQSALTTSFLPISNLVRVIFLTGILFLLVGLWQHHIQKTLTRRVIREHMVVGMGLIGMVVFNVFLR